MSEMASLIDAVEMNDPAGVAKALQARPKLVHAFSERDCPHGPEQWLPLHRAAAMGHAAAARTLLAHGAQPDARTRFTNPYHARATPLHLAAEAGHEPIVSLLLERDATLEVRDAHERSPLARAARHGWLDVLDRLLAAGAMVDPPNAASQTPLHEAIAASEVEPNTVRSVTDRLIQAGADVNARCRHDPAAFTPLHRCVLMGPSRLSVARDLLEAGADPTIADPAHGRTPLELAKHRASFNLAPPKAMLELLQEPARPASQR